MKKFRVLFAFCILSLAALSASASDGPVSGTWKISAEVAGTFFEMTCKVKQEEKKITGTCTGAEVGERAISGEVTEKKAQWTLSTEYNGMALTLVFAGNLDDKSSAISGNLNVQPVGMDGTFSGKKEEPKPEK